VGCFRTKNDGKGRKVAARLTSDMWVSAYLARLRLAAIPAYVLARGDAAAGAVIVKVATLDGQAVAWQRSFDLMADVRVWVVLAKGPEADVDAVLARQRTRDRDLWLIEVEDRAGRSLLDEDGLSG
jgi:hypothetical protein